jgi:hypothetical protein
VEGPISENRSIGKSMVRKWFLNINSDFSLQKATNEIISHIYYIREKNIYIFSSGHRIDNNLSDRGRVEFENEASASFPSPFASKNIEL